MRLQLRTELLQIALLAILLGLSSESNAHPCDPGNAGARVYSLLSGAAVAMVAAPAGLGTSVLIGSIGTLSADEIGGGAGICHQVTEAVLLQAQADAALGLAMVDLMDIIWANMQQALAEANQAVQASWTTGSPFIGAWWAPPTTTPPGTPVVGSIECGQDGCSGVLETMGF